MSRNDAEIEPKSHDFVQLGTYRFYLNNKDLVDETGTTVALRSQSAEVLSYLAVNAGTLVTKDALIEAVWAETFVTDDSVVQCIGDIRRALGDADHKIVQTFPRKGYKLVVPEAPKIEARSGHNRIPGPLKIIAAILVVLVALSGLYFSNLDTDSPVAEGDKPRIAVLAFDDFSAGEDQGYLSDAIAEGIITELARNSRISVIARNSSFRYRAMDTDIRDIGEELGVHYVLEGSQQKSGNGLKVTVQLILASSGEHIWAHTYDQEIGDLFTVQDAIVRTVADRIGTRIERPVPGSDPDKVSAMHLHLKGIATVRGNFNEENNAIDMELNRQAIEIDPDSQFGYVGLAHGYRAAANFGWLGLSQEEALHHGFEAANKALEIAPDDAAVHYVMARLHTVAGNRELAMASYDRAIALNPSASNFLVASTSPMLYAGDTEAAIARLEQAMGIDPFHEEWYHWQMAWALWEIEDCEGALASMFKMNLIPRGAHRQLAGIYACLGEVEKAQEAYQVFYADAYEPTISEQREIWKDVWTAPGSLERFLDHMRIAGMED